MANAQLADYLRSGLCKAADLLSPSFLAWAEQMKESPGWLHRKLWEFCFVAQALKERGLLQKGCRGLGFGVGREPLVALFASYGCSLVGTDLSEEAAQQGGWVETCQHAVNLELLNDRGICDPALFRERVQFRFVDMNAVPPDLRDFDFVWSSCSLEHLGSISHGERFILESMKCLREGGIAVHTTEYNLSSNRHTVNDAQTVLFRKRDIERIVSALQRRGHEIELDLTLGTTPHDEYVDVPPYCTDLHLRLALRRFTTTSIGLIIRKGSPRSAVRDVLADRWLWLKAKVRGFMNRIPPIGWTRKLICHLERSINGQRSGRP